MAASVVLSGCGASVQSGHAAFERGAYATAIRNYRPTVASGTMPGDVAERWDESWRRVFEPARKRITALVEEGRFVQAIDLTRRLDERRQSEPMMHKAYDWYDGLQRRVAEAAVGLNEKPPPDPVDLAHRWKYVQSKLSLTSAVEKALKPQIHERVREGIMAVADTGDLDAALQLSNQLASMVHYWNVESSCQEIRRRADAQVQPKGRENLYLGRAHEMADRYPRLAAMSARVAALWSEYNSRKPYFPPVTVYVDKAPRDPAPIVVERLTGCETQPSIAKQLRKLVERGGVGEPIRVELEMTRCRKSSEVEREDWNRKVRSTIPTRKEGTKLVKVLETRMVPRCEEVWKCSTGIIKKEVAWGNVLSYCPRTSTIYKAIECYDVPVEVEVTKEQSYIYEVYGTFEVAEYGTRLDVVYELAARAKVRLGDLETTASGSASRHGFQGQYAGYRRTSFYGKPGTLRPAKARFEAINAIVRSVGLAASRLERTRRERIIAKEKATAKALLAQVADLVERGRAREGMELMLTAAEEHGAVLTADEQRVFWQFFEAPKKMVLPIGKDTTWGWKNLRRRAKRAAAERAKQYECRVRLDHGTGTGRGRELLLGGGALDADWAEERDELLLVDELPLPPLEERRR